MKILKNKYFSEGVTATRTGLKKQQKVTEIYFTEADNTIDIFTHNTKLKNRFSAFAKEYPELCRCIDDNGFGGMRFEIDRNRFSIRLTKPYSTERKKSLSYNAKRQKNRFKLKE